MTKEQKQLIIVGILIIILVVVGYSSFTPLLKKKKPVVQASSPAAAVPPAAPVESGGEQVDEAKLALQKARAGAGWGRDPFTSQAVKVEEHVTSFKLQGITIGKGTGYAFINDEIVRKGDRIGGYQVVEVFKDRVLLQRGEQKLYLTFPDIAKAREK